MSEFNEVDEITKDSSQNFDDIVRQVEDNINKLPKRKKRVPLDYREFEQFKKGWFYRNWYHRFRRLGQVGVISIPNTSLEDWIVWLYEWSIKMTDDYNQFKKLVWEAIKLHEEHLKILDGRVDDLEDRVEEIERQLVEIWKRIEELTREINEIHNELNNIKNDITNLQNQINNLKTQNNKLIQNLINSGAWEGTLEDGNLKPDRNIATGNINFFGGSTDGGSFIRTNNGQTENDVTAGI